MKGNKGITLIALVVTIIVLLILAGVAIAMLAGQNGVINKAAESSVQNAIGAAKDKCVLIAADALTEYYDRIYVSGTNTDNRVFSSETLDSEIVTAVTESAVDVDGIKVVWTGAASGATVKLTYTDNSSVVGTLNYGKITWDPVNYVGNN